MRHRKQRGGKLNRTSSHCKSLRRNMAISLIKHEKIVTTISKAKYIRPIVEKLITAGKKAFLSKDSSTALHYRRLLLSFFSNEDQGIVNKLCTDVAKKFIDRNGGYLRIVRYKIRAGDSAVLAIICFVDENIANLNTKKEIVADDSSEIEVNDNIIEAGNEGSN